MPIDIVLTFNEKSQLWLRVRILWVLSGNAQGPPKTNGKLIFVDGAFLLVF